MSTKASAYGAPRIAAFTRASPPRPGRRVQLLEACVHGRRRGPAPTRPLAICRAALKLIGPIGRDSDGAPRIGHAGEDSGRSSGPAEKRS